LPQAAAAARSIKGDFMTLVFRTSSVVCSLALAALMAVPAGAQVRRRAVAPGGQAAVGVQITGTAKDATNGLPVESAVVTANGQTVTTNSNGVFQLTLPAGQASTISIQHPAFNSFSQSITAQSGGKYDFALTEKASVTVKTKSGETDILDIGTAQFAYLIAFSGYVRSDNANFCKDDGSDFAPAKTDFSRIEGPATPANAPQCCQFDTVVMSARAVMKSGASLVVHFKDSCSGNEVDFVGREKATGHYQYFNFTNIAEIDFP
jgi:Carboxypeptidase regulatory-like domain